MDAQASAPAGDYSFSPIVRMENDGNAPKSEEAKEDDTDRNGGEHYDLYSYTYPLVQVFSVTLSGVSGDEPGVFGMIEIGPPTEDMPVIFDCQDRLRYERIYPGEDTSLTLVDTDPPFLTAYDPVAIGFKLMHKDHTYGEFEGYRDIYDDGFSNGCYTFNPISHPEDYNKLFALDFRGMFGSAVLRFVAYEHAVPAKVDVTWVGSGVVGDVCGTVKAFPAGRPDHESTLFRRRIDTKDGVAQVQPMGKIPLSRSYIALPFQSALHVKVDLTDRNDGGRQIASGELKFLPPKPQKLGTTQSEVFKQRIGEVEVGVTWIFDMRI